MFQALNYPFTAQPPGTKCQVPYTRAHAIMWMTQTAEAVSFLHAIKPKSILHRDLKTANILLTDNYRNVKLADFGFARPQATEMTNRKGTLYWMAPEVSRRLNNRT